MTMAKRWRMHAFDPQRIAQLERAAGGMTGTAILYLCLKLLGGDVGYFVPNRLEDGYGLNDDALRALAERGAKLIVTVDCGISGVAEAETARELGLELIITDHHEF